MKTNKKVLAIIATTAILTLGITSTYASGGNGNGQGMGQGQGKGQHSQMNGGSGQQNNKQEHNPGDFLEGIEKQDLSEAEKDMLYYGYSEELLARDMYDYFYELYGTQVFKNIANSEQQHMDAVKVLLDRYELEVPTTYGDLTDAYEALKTEGAIGLKEALEVGVKIEILDIDDISETIKNTDNDDFKIIFTRIGGASYNHMRGFLKALGNAGYTTDIDYSDYLSYNDLDSKGSISYKLAEKLESEGVSLPETATSTYLKENCNDGESGGNMGNGQGNNSNNGNGNVKNNSYKSKYYGVIKSKYQSQIDAMSEESLNTLLSKIDDLREKISSSDSYSSYIKSNYLAILDALKDIVLEKFGQDELNLDALFE